MERSMEVRSLAGSYEFHFVSVLLSRMTLFSQTQTLKIFYIIIHPPPALAWPRLTHQSAPITDRIKHTHSRPGYYSDIGQKDGEFSLLSPDQQLCYAWYVLCLYFWALGGLFN